MQKPAETAENSTRGGRRCRPQTLDLPAPPPPDEEARWGEVEEDLLETTSSLEAQADEVEEMEDAEEDYSEESLYTEEEEGQQPDKAQQVPPKAPRKRAAPRWDRSATSIPPADQPEEEDDSSSSSGKPEQPSPPPPEQHQQEPIPTVTAAHLRYRSWRRWRFPILECLRTSGGDTAFVRRYMLFKHGVSIPPGVIRYYHSYRRRRRSSQR